MNLIKQQIDLLEPLRAELIEAFDFNSKLRIVQKSPLSIQFMRSSAILQNLTSSLDISGQYIIHSMLALGQGSVVFCELDRIANLQENFKNLVQHLLEIENFYSFLGGIVGYHLLVIKMIDSKLNQSSAIELETVNYDEPEGLDISVDSTETRKAVRIGIENLKELVEIYPLGGAGDRLNLKDEKNGDDLPAAQLSFCGRTLLEGLIRDLQGREYLHYKLFGGQQQIPLAIMTSHEKDNHHRILEICESKQWFGRIPNSFDFFIQHSVPMLTVEGKWAMHGPLKPIFKPGGHGVIWKFAKDQGVFERFAKIGRKKALVRQINNPVAGLDHGLLALFGVGCKQNKDFGFASCPRLLNAAEGMDVLCERKKDDGYDYCITNIEYTEFEQKGIRDAPRDSGSPFSHFPANTNILFVNMEALEPILKKCSIPGLMINMKSKAKCYEEGQIKERPVVRLESTMQNIADYIIDHSPKQLVKGQRGDLRTFLIYNERRKTISVVKQAYHSGQSIVGTPEGCFYELMQNYFDLLTTFCGMEMPPIQNESEYLAEGPSYVVLFHPSLGPLYSVIGQKISQGRIGRGSELILEISEANIINLDLEGSLVIEADAIFGKKDARGVFIYDAEQAGKCTLINVKVRNSGIEPVGASEAWKCKGKRRESLQITLHGNAEFFAENVVLEGNIHFEVPAGQKLVVYMQGSEIAWHCEKIQKATWQWSYNFDDEDRICLERVE